MAFAARVASKPVSSLKVKKGVTKAIQKPEKLPIEKAPPSFKWNPIPSDLPAILAQNWTQVGSSKSDDRAPSCSTSPVNNPWVEYLTAKEQSVDKCDPHVKGHADLRSPKPKDTEVSSDSENVSLEVKIDDDKVEDDKVDNVAKPELPTVAQKKAQEKAEFEEALATTRTNDRLIESCKLYIKAHHIIRQALHCVRAVSVADSVVTDGYQRMLLEFFTSKPKAYWADNHHETETHAKHFINELKTSHGQNTPKDKDVRLKCDILLENMNDVIAQDLFCINDTYHENALEEIENNYLEVVFNPWGKLPTLFDFRDKLDTKLRKIMNGPAWSPRAVQESLDKYIGRQHTIRALPVGSNIQYKNDMEKDLHLQYSIHKAEFDRKLAEDREGLIANYLKFWRWQQKVVMDSLPKFQNRRVAILLLLFELMTTCSLEYPTELDKKIDVVLFDAQALEAKYNEYYLLKTPFGVTEHSKDYTMLLFDVRVSVRREEFAEDVQALVEDGQVPVENCQAPAGEDQVQVEGSQAQEEDGEAPTGESQAQEDDGEAPLGDSPAPTGE